MLWRSCLCDEVGQDEGRFEGEEGVMSRSCTGQLASEKVDWRGSKKTICSYV